MMKVCSLKRLLKYSILISSTSFITTVVFHFVRQPRRTHFQADKNVEYESIHRVGRSNKIDWHNEELIASESRRQGWHWALEPFWVGCIPAASWLCIVIHLNDIDFTGNGEHGIAAKLPDDFEKEKYDDLYNTNGFNALLSDDISINRSLPDIRHEDCRRQKYHSRLPDVSIIVPFHNEHWSTLLRTVYSAINRSPPELLKEIILVDDFSSKSHCKKQLDDYVASKLPKVKVVHLKSRQGLIRARLAGAHNATGQVLVFLDSHTEANVNWLPPLLDPIADNYRTCVCPFIDVIDYETFEYRAQDEGARGAFDWEFFYKRLPLLPEDHENPTKPFKSPVMAGGLFAISTRFFWELGGYDPGLDIWGGEQYELSFKIWQCGGNMVDAPCSRVGHIYRKFAPFPNPEIGDFIGRNYRRVAEVWMDEYAEYLYKRRPQYRSVDPGDLTKQREIRERLGCKPFKWFMEEVAFDLVKRYPPIEPSDYGSGKIMPILNDQLCLTAIESNKTTELQDCFSVSSNDRRQEFLLSWHKDIKVHETSSCLDVSDIGPKAAVNLFACHQEMGNQLWRYDLETHQFISGRSNRCLDHDTDERRVYVETCDDLSKTQKWMVDILNKDALRKWENTVPLLE